MLVLAAWEGYRGLFMAKDQQLWQRLLVLSSYCSAVIICTVLVKFAGSPDAIAELRKVLNSLRHSNHDSDPSPNLLALSSKARRCIIHCIKHARMLLEDPKNTQWPILVIGLESGFASVGPFTRAFKSICDMTPNQYRQFHQSTTKQALSNVIGHQHLP
jgi:AraC-like DNA-binding protein